MNGLNTYRNINNARAYEALQALKTKATEAEKQNHPKAAEFRAHADKLEAELKVVH
jgi:hypothetical protein